LFYSFIKKKDKGSAKKKGYTDRTIAAVEPNRTVIETIAASKENFDQITSFEPSNPEFYKKFLYTKYGMTESIDTLKRKIEELEKEKTELEPYKKRVIEIETNKRQSAIQEVKDISSKLVQFSNTVKTKAAEVNPEKKQERIEMAKIAQDNQAELSKKLNEFFSDKNLPENIIDGFNSNMKNILLETYACNEVMMGLVDDLEFQKKQLQTVQNELDIHKKYVNATSANTTTPASVAQPQSNASANIPPIAEAARDTSYLFENAKREIEEKKRKLMMKEPAVPPPAK